MKIYIVEAEQGEYSDRQQWTVKAFRSEKKAEKFTNKVNKTVEQITDKYNELRKTWRWDDDLPEWKELFENLLDPMLEHNWHGCQYYFYEMELE